MLTLDRYWQGFTHLFFPQRCAGCDAVLRHQEEVLCTGCLYHLPKTDHHTDPKNETARQLWGKVPIQYAASMLMLSKSSRVQRMIHHLKYSNQPDIGVYLGRMYGQRLKGSLWIDTIDLIVPVPIHAAKVRSRGYNQSVYFAKGLSEVLHIPCHDGLLKRTVNSVSQTKKSRSERYENVANVFACDSKQPSRNPTHILLVDDVMTTGATVAAAAQALIDGLGCSVSIVTIARA